MQNVSTAFLASFSTAKLNIAAYQNFQLKNLKNIKTFNYKIKHCYFKAAILFL